MPAVSAGRLALVLGVLVALGPLAIDTYLPALPAMAASYGVAVTAIETSVGAYMLGTAFGQLLGGALSDQVGRKPVAWAGLLLFALCSVLITWTRTPLQLDVLRFVQALGGGATVVIAGASVRDHFEGHHAARVLTMIGLVMLIAPLLAPVIGAVFLAVSGWQLIFWALAVYAMLVALVIYGQLPTVAPANQGRGLGGVLRGYRQVLGSRHGVSLILTNSFAFACMFCFVTDSAFVYMEFFRVGEQQFPLYFGANILVMIALNRLNIVLLRYFDSGRIVRWGLWLQLLSAIALLLLTQSFPPSLWFVVPLIMAVVGLIALIMPNAMALLIHQFPHNSGAATGLNGASQFFCAGVVGYLISHWHDHSLLPMTGMMVLTGVLALLAFYWGKNTAAE